MPASRTIRRTLALSAAIATATSGVAAAAGTRSFKGRTAQGTAITFTVSGKTIEPGAKTSFKLHCADGSTLVEHLHRDVAGHLKKGSTTFTNKARSLAWVFHVHGKKASGTLAGNVSYPYKNGSTTTCTGGTTWHAKAH